MAKKLTCLTFGLNGIDETGESTLSEIVSLYIVFSHLLTISIVYYSTKRMSACARYNQISEADPLFRAVPGDAPAAGERLLGRPRIPTLAERSPRHIWAESTRCGEPAARNEGASGK